MPEIVADNIAVINSDELEGTTRIDAEYYQPKYLRMVANILNKTQMQIKDVATLEKRKFNSNNEGEFDYIEISEISLSDGSYKPVRMPNKNAPSRAQRKLEPNDVIISTVRPIRNAVSLINKVDNVPLVCSSGFAVLKSSKLLSEYLFVWLKSKYTCALLDRLTTATMYPAVSDKDILTFPIPILSTEMQLEIQNLILKSKQLQKQSLSFYSQAKSLLLDELGIKDIDLSHEPCYEVNSADTITANRIDAEYYQPKYEKVIEAIKRYPCTPIGNMFRLVKGVEPGSSVYYDKGKPFIRVSNLNKFEINNDNQQYLPEKNYSELKANYQPLKSEILLSKDATPGIAYHLKDQIDGIISSGILRLQALSNIKREYICLVINSIVGQSQIERDSGGSVINHWKPSQVQETLIPVLPDKIQEKIELLCLESQSARRTAKGLLEEAKRKVEEMIEKGSE